MDARYKRTSTAAAASTATPRPPAFWRNDVAALLGHHLGRRQKDQGHNSPLGIVDERAHDAGREPPTVATASRTTHLESGV